MPTLDPTKLRDRPLPFHVPQRGLVFWQRLIPLLRILAHKAGYKLSFEGVDALESADGDIHLKAKGGDGESAAQNFICAIDGNGRLTVTPGTYNGVVPVIGTTKLDAATTPALFVGTGGHRYVYCAVGYSFGAGSGGFTNSAVETEWFITTSISELASPLGPSPQYFYFLLAHFFNGSKIHQYITTDIAAEPKGTYGGATLSRIM